MQLTEPQRRTLDGLIGTGDRPTFPADLAQRLRDRIEGAARELELAEPLWLGKEKLNQHGRCEGLFQSVLAGEAPPFAHSARSAHGVLLHKAIEVEVGAREGMDPHEIAQVAVGRVLEREERFAEYWGGLTVSEQDDTLMEVVRRVALFQGSFPPLKPLRRELSPISELRVRAELLGGDLVLSGQIDLVLGLPDRLEPNRATRLVVDLKTGSAYPEFAEDMRFYALVMTLAVRRAALPGGVAVPRERYVAGRGRDRGDPAARRRPRDRSRSRRSGPLERARARAHSRRVLRLVPTGGGMPRGRAPVGGLAPQRGRAREPDGTMRAPVDDLRSRNLEG